MYLQSLSPELFTHTLLRYWVLGASSDPIFPLASNHWYGLCFSSDSQIPKQFSDNNALDKELYWIPVAYLYSKKTYSLNLLLLNSYSKPIYPYRFESLFKIYIQIKMESVWIRLLCLLLPTPFRKNYMLFIVSKAWMTRWFKGIENFYWRCRASLTLSSRVCGNREFKLYCRPNHKLRQLKKLILRKSRKTFSMFAFIFQLE